jgi:transitional endoplasmic reticulum ATPase
MIITARRPDRVMYGPPGCGKTMMAKAAAHESGAAFINVRTSTIMSRYVGESEQHIKEVFEAAREHEKAIIFFDEIDSIASRRSESEDYIKRVVNELLTQLDGVDTSNDNFLVIAATNTPWLIDPAFRRPGRFSKLLLIPEPDHPAREAILSNNFKNKPFTGIHAADIAAMTAGYSGADLTALCEDALDLPLHEALSTGNTRPVNMGDIMQALDGRQSSTRSWYIEAERELEKYGEKDIFTF